MTVTLNILGGGTLRVSKEQAEKMLRIQKHMRGRSYSLPNNLELIDGKIVRKGSQRTSREATE